MKSCKELYECCHGCQNSVTNGKDIVMCCKDVVITRKHLVRSSSTGVAHVERMVLCKRCKGAVIIITRKDLVRSCKAIANVERVVSELLRVVRM